MKPRAYGIVRVDIVKAATDEYVDDIRSLARIHGWDLRAVFEEPSDASFPVLFATLESSGVAAVVVPSVAHVAGWMDVLRQAVDVWTLCPHRRWLRDCVGDASR
jgi:hypothetical protein